MKGHKTKYDSKLKAKVALEAIQEMKTNAQFVLNIPSITPSLPAEKGSFAKMLIASLTQPHRPNKITDSLLNCMKGLDEFKLS